MKLDRSIHAYISNRQTISSEASWPANLVTNLQVAISRSFRNRWSIKGYVGNLGEDKMCQPMFHTCLGVPYTLLAQNQ